MQTRQVLIQSSLEQVAEIAGDITPLVYEHFFNRSDKAHALLAHTDPGIQGNMMAEVFRLLMLDEYSDEQGYLNFETKNHKGYDVLPEMYEPFMNSVKQVMIDALADKWTKEIDDAWEQQLEMLLSEIRQRVA